MHFCRDMKGGYVCGILQGLKGQNIMQMLENNQRLDKRKSAICIQSCCTAGHGGVCGVGWGVWGWGVCVVLCCVFVLLGAAGRASCLYVDQGLIQDFLLGWGGE